MNESLAVLTAKGDTYSTKVESLEKIANVTEVRLHDLETAQAKLEGITQTPQRENGINRKSFPEISASHFLHEQSFL